MGKAYQTASAMNQCDRMPAESIKNAHSDKNPDTDESLLFPMPWK